MKALSSSVGRAADLGPLLMRFGLGAAFAYHGWVKFDGGVDNFAGFLDSLGVPLADVVAPLQITAEGIGGLLLMAGLLTRLVTLPLIGILIGAILLVKAEGGFLVEGGPGFSYEIVLMAGLLGLLFVGPGRYSLDAVIGIEGRESVGLAWRHRQALAS
jgi:putative oxidoreductase